MPHHDLTITLSENELSALKGAIGNIELTDDLIRLFVELAIDDYVKWLTGQRRFASIAEADTYKIFHLFRDIRGEPPSVEVLANELALSPGRAASVISRLKYGEARTLVKMVDRAGADIIDRELMKGNSKKLDEELTIWCRPEVYDSIFHAASEIMLNPDRHNRDSRWERAQKPSGSRDKYASTIVAQRRMWTYIRDLLREWGAG